MPYKHPTAAAVSNRERQRRFRERRREERRLAAMLPPETPPDVLPSDAADILAAWCSERLCVPPGHPLEGQPMHLPAYVRTFLADVLQPAVKEGLLCTARKNSKTGGIAMFVLGLMVGPLRRPGMRIGTVSINREKAGELLGQCRAIAEASNLEGMDFMRTPAPGLIRGPDGATAEFLSADKSAGHASGFDWSIVDELGLMVERDRDLIAGMRSATSARNGKLIALSIRGESPMLEEMLERRDLPTCAVHLYAPDVIQGADVDIHDRRIWAAGNPGLAVGIKAWEYMEAEAARVTVTPTDLNSFLAFDLNLPQAPTREMIFAPSDLTACVAGELPERSGNCYLGLDFGGATSGTAACAIFPETGRVELWFGFGDVPDVVARGRVDGARYDLMHQRGELTLYPGRVTPVDAFMSDVAESLAGVNVKRMAADGYKDGEVKDYLDRAGLHWRAEFRRVGAGKDGSRDVRALQRLVLNRKLKLPDSLALVTAVSKSAIRRDGNGNPGLDKADSRGRIDLLSAAVIAAGLAEPEFDKPASKGVYLGLAG